MLKFLFFACFFIFPDYCNCKKIPLTDKEIEDGFTIVLPRQEQYSSIKCYLEMAKDGETKSDFYPEIDIRKMKKYPGGMEYVSNYYKTGKNDSCTFRVYPKILSQFFDIYQMRYWNVTMKNRITETNELPEKWETRTSLFYMNSWSWWKEEHVNTLILEFSHTLIPWELSGSLEYLNVDRKVMDNAFTIVLPREKEFSSLSCYLKIAVDGHSIEKFYTDRKEIREKKKDCDGMEYVPNYYNTGKNDSCTFRIYPEILDKLSDRYQMRSWLMSMDIIREGEHEKKTLLFYMNTWSTWKDHRANTAEVKPIFHSIYGGLKYRFI